MVADASPNHVAIVGMAGRFPGAESVASFWTNLRDGIESVAVFSEEQLLASGVSEALIRDASYVPAKGWLDTADAFDASFFGVSPGEAVLIDPQHRLFLETAWEALEDAGYDPQRIGMSTGVYGGCGSNWYQQLHFGPTVTASSGTLGLHLRLGNDRDFLTCRVSYKLGLRGPSVSVATACSTSLVAVHLGVQALVDGECDLAVAGGVSISVPLIAGYRHEPGSIASRDGHCRAFDRKASGTVGGDGVGVIVLRRLHDALAEGDHIHAVIRGSAVNNDGAAKAGFTAPNPDAQAAVIREALAIAEVAPSDVGYIEAHGTGTRLGDAVEIDALRRAFGEPAGRRCWIGSVKTNIGHLDAAAGIAGLIKAVLALKHEEIPPSLHFEQPNPDLELEASGFVVAGGPVAWHRGPSARYAGVSSFGMGGTNAHVVLEEAPLRETPPAPEGWELLVLSARTPTALATQRQSLSAHLRTTPVALRDVAWTLRAGRSEFSHRVFVVARDDADAAAGFAAAPTFAQPLARTDPPVAFLFPGDGTQCVGMGAELYARFGVFRRWVDEGASVLEPFVGSDIRAVLLGADSSSGAADHLEEPRILQPVLALVEFAVAQLLRSEGIEPWALLGHSLGEYVAACLAGVFSFADLLRLTAARGTLMQALPPGAMAAIDRGVDDVVPLLGADVDLAAVNGQGFCVVGGPVAAMPRFERRAAATGASVVRLPASCAMHTRMVDPMLPGLEHVLDGTQLRRPTTSYLSCVTGTWVTPDEPTSPAHWLRQTRERVQFGEALGRMCDDEPDALLVEVGPGRTLCGFARRSTRPPAMAVHALPTREEAVSEVPAFLNVLGRLWVRGVPVRHFGQGPDARPCRVALPTYPFERERCWPVETVARPTGQGPLPSADGDLGDVAEQAMAKVESAVRAIWQEVLGVELIQPDDNFFDLGGDSLLALRVLGRVREAFGVDLEVRELFEGPTIGHLAAAVQQQVLTEVKRLSDHEAAKFLTEGSNG